MATPGASWKCSPSKRSSATTHSAGVNRIAKAVSANSIIPIWRWSRRRDIRCSFAAAITARRVRCTTPMLAFTSRPATMRTSCGSARCRSTKCRAAASRFALVVSVLTSPPAPWQSSAASAKPARDTASTSPWKAGPGSPGKSPRAIALRESAAPEPRGAAAPASAAPPQ